MFDVTINHQITAGNAVYVGYALAGAIYSAVFLVRNLRGHTLRMRLFSIIVDDALRFAGGFFLLCVAFLFRIGGWLPWRAMAEAGNFPLWNTWRDLSWIWTDAGMGPLAVGMTLIMWLALRRKFGVFALSVAVAFPVACHLAGTFGTELMAHAFRPGPAL